MLPWPFDECLFELFGDETGCWGGLASGERESIQIPAHHTVFLLSPTVPSASIVQVRCQRRKLRSNEASDSGSHLGRGAYHHRLGRCRHHCRNQRQQVRVAAQRPKRHQRHRPRHGLQRQWHLASLAAAERRCAHLGGSLRLWQEHHQQRQGRRLGLARRPHRNVQVGADFNNENCNYKC